MSDVERIFFHMVCAECRLHSRISEEWLKKVASKDGIWSYDNLLEFLGKWYLDEVYTFVGKVANGRLEFAKMRGEYRGEEKLSRRWSE